MFKKFRKRVVAAAIAVACTAGTVAYQTLPPDKKLAIKTILTIAESKNETPDITNTPN